MIAWPPDSRSPSPRWSRIFPTATWSVSKWSVSKAALEPSHRTAAQSRRQSRVGDRWPSAPGPLPSQPTDCCDFRRFRPGGGRSRLGTPVTVQKLSQSSDGAGLRAATLRDHAHNRRRDGRVWFHARAAAGGGCPPERALPLETDRPDRRRGPGRGRHGADGAALLLGIARRHPRPEGPVCDTPETVTDGPRAAQGGRYAAWP